MSITLRPIEKIPEAKRDGAKGSKYGDILMQFLDNPASCVMVSKGDTKPTSLASALRAAIANDERIKGKVTVRSRVVKGETTVILEKLAPKA